MCGIVLRKELSSIEHSPSWPWPVAGSTILDSPRIVVLDLHTYVALPICLIQVLGCGSSGSHKKQSGSRSSLSEFEIHQGLCRARMD